MTEIDWGLEIVRLLAPWRLRDARVAAQLTDLGDRARVWRVDTGDGPVVAKLTFDQPGAVEPGLRIAEVVQAAGIPTGVPIRTADGKMSTTVDRAPGRPWTLALHRFVPGPPLDRDATDAPELAGGLLGKVHRILAQSPQTPAPAGRLLEYYAGEAAGGTGPRATALAEALTAVAAAAGQVRLDEGVLYGDPAPEILLEPATSRLALIDWGTPSFGPLMHDIVSWQLFLTSAIQPEERTVVEARFTDAYLSQNPIDKRQFEVRDAFTRLHHAIHNGWTPSMPG